MRKAFLFVRFCTCTTCGGFGTTLTRNQVAYVCKDCNGMGSHLEQITVDTAVLPEPLGSVVSSLLSNSTDGI